MDANSESFPSAGSLLKKSNALIRSLLSFACSLTLLPAQEETVSMKIDLVAWGDSIGGLSLKSAEANGTLVAMAFQYSKPVNYSGPALLEIYKSGDGGLPPRPEPSEEDKLHESMPLRLEDVPVDPAKEAAAKTPLALELENRRKEKPTLVALAQLPANCRRATVLLAPSAGGTFIAYVIDDDPTKLPIGQLRIHNLSPFPIAVRCNGDKAMEMKTRDTKLVAIKDQQCFYEIACKDTEEWRILENNIIPVRANEQTQMIILKSKNQYFLSNDGSSGGFLQTVILRRNPNAPPPPVP
jgi:hypothetical protein